MKQYKSYTRVCHVSIVIFAVLTTTTKKKLANFCPHDRHCDTK